MATQYTVTIGGKPRPITNQYRLRKVAPTREERARLLVAAGAVHPQGNGRYFVESATERLEGVRGVGYAVDVNEHTCQCKDFERGNTCQHLFAVAQYIEIMRGSVRPHAAVA